MDLDVEGDYSENLPTMNNDLDKYPKFKDSSLEFKIAQAERVVFNLYLARYRPILPDIIEERKKVSSQIKGLLCREKRLSKIIQLKRKDSKHEETSEVRTYSVRSINRERGGDLCSSEKELNQLICSLCQRMQHQNKTLVKQRNTIKAMKHINGTRENVLANEKMKAKEGTKILNDNLDGIIMEKEAVSRDNKFLQSQLKQLMDMPVIPSPLYKNLGALEKLRIEACRNLVKLRKQHDVADKLIY